MKKGSVTQQRCQQELRTNGVFSRERDRNLQPENSKCYALGYREEFLRAIAESGNSFKLEMNDFINLAANNSSRKANNIASRSNTGIFNLLSLVAAQMEKQHLKETTDTVVSGVSTTSEDILVVTDLSF